MKDRWHLQTECEHCAGTGIYFYCEVCDVDRPQDCLHEADGYDPSLEEEDDD